MKICIINGQNHKGSTYHIGKMLANKIDGEVTEFFLPKDFDEFCCGCTNCFMICEEKCPHYEKLKPVTEAVDEADILILTSPVYVYHCTASMKAWLDHYGWRWIVHRPEEKMFSKRAVVISTAAGAGMKSTNKDMKDSLTFWGVPKVYSVGMAVNAVSWSEVPEKKKRKIERITDQISEKLRKDNFKPKASLKAKFFFTFVRIMMKKGWNHADMEYWNAKDWTGKKRPWKL